eukprot:jgi/Botrbrau1/21217/Bobra.39_2s0018.1
MFKYLADHDGRGKKAEMDVKRRDARFSSTAEAPYAELQFPRQNQNRPNEATPGAEKRPKAKFIRLIWVDSAGLRRARVVPIYRLDQVLDEGVSVTQAIPVLPVWGDVMAPGGGLTVCGEFRLVPDEATLKRLAWHPAHSQLICDLHNPLGTVSPYCPRGALKGALQAAEQGYGLTFLVGFETEVVFLRPDPKAGDSVLPPPVDTTVYAQTRALNAVPAVLDGVADALQQMGIDVEQYHAESGHGQFEFVTGHDSALTAVDNLVATREAISGVASSNSLVASFLPKLFQTQAGCGCHAHISIWKNGENLSKDFRSSQQRIADNFLGGILQHLPGLMPFLVPTPNGYQRLAPGCWSGSFWIWGEDNKEAPVRVLSDNVEIKTLDATANPYIALAALITAGLVGLKQGLSLPSPSNFDPGQLSAEERAEKGVEALPPNLGAALDALQKDTELLTALEETLGHQLIQAYLATRKSELAYFADKSFDEQVLLLYQRY